MLRPRSPPSDAAVSEVMGTIFLVALAVVFATVFALMIFTLPPPAPTSHASLQAYVLPTSPDKLIVEHRGGPAIPLSQLAATVTVNGTQQRVTVGGATFASGWSVIGADGIAKASTASFAAGDRAIYTSPSLRGAALSVQVVNGATTQGTAALALTGAAVQPADAQGPTITSANTLTTTTIQVNLSEALNASTLSAADFSIDNIPASAIHGYGNGSAVELTAASAFATGATPTIRSAIAPSSTKDVPGNLLANSSAVARDGVAPAISAITPGTTTTTTQVIGWTSSESSSPNRVLYGPTPDLGITAAATSGTSPSVTLGALTPQTQYYFEVVSVDANGNSATSAQGTFTTGSPTSTSAQEATNHLVWTTTTPLFSGVLSTNFNVTLQDTGNNTATVTSSTALTLSTNSSSGYFTDLSGNPISTVQMNASQSWAAFRYMDWRENGTTTLEVSGPGMIPATTTIQVTGPGGRTFPYHLGFSNLPASTASGATSSGIKVTLLDEFDAPTIPPWNVLVNLSTNSTNGYFLAAGTSTIVTSRTITAAVNNVTFDYLDSRNAGPSLITATANNTIPASAVISITGRSGHGIPDHLELQTNSTTVASPGIVTITARLRDSNDQVTTAPANIVLNLTSSSVGGFFQTTGASTPIGAVTLPGGSSTVTFDYGDTGDNAGSARLLVAAQGLIDGSMNLSVATNPPAFLATAQTWTAVQTFGAGKLSVTNVLSNGGTATLSLPQSTDTLLGRATTDTISGPKTFNAGDLIVAGAGAGTGTLAYANSASSTTATLPANTGTVAELNLAQTWSAVQTFGSGNLAATNILTNGGAATLTLPTATDTLVGRGTTDTFTGAKTFNTGDLLVNGGGSGSVTLAYTNTATGSTATFPTNTGTVAELNLAQTWTALQTFGTNAALDGSDITSGTVGAARLPYRAGSATIAAGTNAITVTFSSALSSASYNVGLSVTSTGNYALNARCPNDNNGDQVTGCTFFTVTGKSTTQFTITLRRTLDGAATNSNGAVTLDWVAWLTN